MHGTKVAGCKACPSDAKKRFLTLGLNGQELLLEQPKQEDKGIITCPSVTFACLTCLSLSCSMLQ